jgi:hypothetical protein
MKRLILILCIFLTCSLSGVSPPIKTLIIANYEPIKPFLILWEAVTIVESNKDATAYNKLSQATGIAQITPILVKDYNNRSGKSYMLNDCYDIQISKEIFMFYCMLYRTSDFEYIARRWNGSGYKTKKYWRRVKSELNK